MTSRRRPVTWITLIVFLALLRPGPLRVTAQQAELTTVAPKEAGFSSERLAALDGSLKKYVDDGALAGIVALVTRHGKIVSSTTYGHQDVARKVPMRSDTIFRIYSMTKPIAGVAMMKLYEQGKWRPDDPLSKHIPEFADLQVYSGTDSSGKPLLEKPAHAPAVGDIVFVGMIQRIIAPDMPNLQDLSRTLVQQALLAR